VSDQRLIVEILFVNDITQAEEQINLIFSRIFFIYISFFF
jgi:hypothetical protein